MKSVVIAEYLRSPQTFASKGAMAKIRPDTMAAEVVKALVDKTGIDPGEIEDLILGCAFPEAEQGMNVARLVVLPQLRGERARPRPSTVSVAI